MTAIRTSTLVSGIDATVATISSCISGGGRVCFPETVVSRRIAGSRTSVAYLAISRTGAKSSMGRGTFLQAVAAHADLPTAEGSLVVVEVTKLGIHEVIKKKEQIHAMSNRVSRAATVQTKVIAVMARVAPVVRNEQRFPQSWILRVKVPCSHCEGTVPDVGSGGPRIEVFLEGLCVLVNDHDCTIHRITLQSTTHGLV